MPLEDFLKLTIRFASILPFDSFLQLGLMAFLELWIP